MPMFVKAGIDASGYRTAVRDYTEPSVVEELAANSYDADATTCLVLLDSRKNVLHVIDNGLGFTSDAIERVAILGGGDKQSVPFSKGKRHYLGSYGYGLKSTLNIASKLRIYSISEDGEFDGGIDWGKLDDALKPEFPGFAFNHAKRNKHQVTGTRITLSLNNPTSKDHLEQFGDHLANLPTDGGKFRCYFGNVADAARHVPTITTRFERLDVVAKRLARAKALTLGQSSRLADLNHCQIFELKDKEGSGVTGQAFFAGIQNGKVLQLKKGLRGIYVRINGRLLKQSFTDSGYTYNISRWKKFESGLRVELTVDWLRDQISLSRGGVRFANSKLEQDFKSALARMVSQFIQPQLKKLAAKAARESGRKAEQRFELANKRIKKERSVMVRGLKSGFPFRPETDGELALVLAQKDVLRNVSPWFSLVDYNDKAPYDCLIHDSKRREFIKTELEPTLVEWIQHRETDDVEMVVCWTLGKWRIGARKNAQTGSFMLAAGDGEGKYKLLEYARSTSQKPRKDYDVVVLDEVLN